MSRGKRPNTPGNATPRKGGLAAKRRRYVRKELSPEEQAERTAANKEKADAAFEVIAAGVRQINDVPSLRLFLDGIRGKNAGYSFNNQMLIRARFPESKAVGVKNYWSKMGRRIKQDEWANPAFLLRPDRGFYVEDKVTGDKIFIPTGWAPMRVYDLSQTEGDELPDSFFTDNKPPIVGDAIDAKTLGLRAGRWAESMSLSVKPGTGVAEKNVVQYDPALELNDRAVEVTRQTIKHALSEMPKFAKMEKEEQVLAVEVATYTLASGYGLDIPQERLNDIKFVAKNPEKLQDALNIAQKAVCNFIKDAS